MVFSQIFPLWENRCSNGYETFGCLVYRIVEKAILVVFFSYLFFTTGSLVYLNEKAIMRRKIERVKDAVMSFSYSDKCATIIFRSQAKGKDAKEEQGFG